MLRIYWNLLYNLINKINNHLKKHSPTKIIIGTFISIRIIEKFLQFYKTYNTKQLKINLTDTALQAIEKLPIIGPKLTASINKEVKGLLLGIKNDIDKSRSEWEPIHQLPKIGFSEIEIKERFKNVNAKYKPGSLSAAVYSQFHNNESKLLQSIWSKTAFTNPVFLEWPLINLMEAELISICQHLLNGEVGAPGIMTRGGTISILEACKAYVLLARKNDLNPEIIVPDSIHVAFDKAAKVLNAKLIKIPVNKLTGAANVKAIEKAISKHTCMIACSAPSFPFGIIDPITDLGKLAQKHNIPLHVDACLGGFLTAFAKDAGYDLPPCDFSVPGVSSISIDTHKYGQTPKGSSFLLFSKNCPATPTHVYLDWVGGMYVTPSIDGSRSGADIATTWTVLCHKGANKYIQETRKILNLHRALLNEVNKIDGIFVPFNPEISIVPIQSIEGINSLVIADLLKEKGWSVNILQSPDQTPLGFHFCVTSIHANQKDFLKLFIKDLSNAVQFAKQNPEAKPNGMPKAYGKLEKGVPFYVQDKIGNGYIKVITTLPGVEIPGIWSKPREEEQKTQGFFTSTDKDAELTQVRRDAFKF